MQYNKPFLTLQGQADLLRGRGLQFDDDAIVKNALSNAGYYHLSAYFKFFQNGDDTFKEGATFQSIMDLYAFDRRLTLLFFDAIERIEISLRSRSIEVCAPSHTPYWYQDTSLYSNREYVQQMMEKWKEDIDRMKLKDGILKEFYSKYDNEWPPCWIFFETISFGQITKIFQNLQRPIRRNIAVKYGISEDVLLSILRGLVDIRNICAHHERLWNRIVKQRKVHRNEYVSYKTNTVFAYIVGIVDILKKASPTSTWPQRVHDFLQSNTEYLESLGCPEDWQEYFNS